MEQKDLYKYVTKGDVMNAYENGAEILCADKDKNRFVPVKTPCWDWTMYDYIIGNKTKDGLCFHEFVEKVIGERYVFQEKDGDIWKNYVPRYLNKKCSPEHIKTLRLKPKEYVPFEWKDRNELWDKRVKHKKEKMELKINRFEVSGLGNFQINRFQADYLFENFTFMDGSVFGKKKE